MKKMLSDHRISSRLSVLIHSEQNAQHKRELIRGSLGIT